MKKRAKPKKSNRNIAIALLVLVVFAFIVYAAWRQYVPTRWSWTAAEYFQIESAAVEPTGKEKIDLNGTLWVIYGITFTFKPILGDAHAVVVQSWANSPSDEGQVGDLSKNQTTIVTLISPNGAAIRETNGKFPVKIYINSVEANGPLTLNLST